VIRAVTRRAGGDTPTMPRSEAYHVLPAIAEQLETPQGGVRRLLGVVTEVTPGATDVTELSSCLR
jgi:hypothetical protein